MDIKHRIDRDLVMNDYQRFMDVAVQTAIGIVHDLTPKK